MQAFSLWVRSMPRRELVRGAVVLALAMMMLEDWLDCLAEFGRGDLAEGVEEMKGLVFFAPVVWGVLRDPRKWGFRVGMFGLVALILGVVVVGALYWWAPTHPEDPFSRQLLAEHTLFWWFDTVMRVVAFGMLVAAAISLRWLYPKEGVSLSMNVGNASR